MDARDVSYPICPRDLWRDDREREREREGEGNRNDEAHHVSHLVKRGLSFRWICPHGGMGRWMDHGLVPEVQRRRARQSSTEKNKTSFCEVWAAAAARAQPLVVQRNGNDYRA